MNLKFTLLHGSGRGFDSSALPQFLHLAAVLGSSHVADTPLEVCIGVSLHERVDGANLSARVFTIARGRNWEVSWLVGSSLAFQSDGAEVLDGSFENSLWHRWQVVEFFLG